MFEFCFLFSWYVILYASKIRKVRLYLPKSHVVIVYIYVLYAAELYSLAFEGSDVGFFCGFCCICVVLLTSRIDQCFPEFSEY